MADTITLPGTGSVVATDEVTIAAVLQHVQRMKLADGTDGGTDLIPGTAANGLDVDVTRVQGTVIIQGQQSAIQSGNVTTATSVVGPFTCSGYNLATVVVAGTYAGVTAVFEGSIDGTNWFQLQGQRSDNNMALEPGPTTLTNTVRAWDIELGGLTEFRVRATAWTSGTAAFSMVFQTMPNPIAPSAGMLVGAPTTGLPIAVGWGNGQQVIPVNFVSVANTVANAPVNRSMQALAVSQSPNMQNAYMASTNGTVAIPTTAGTTTSLAYLFHTAAQTARYEITRIEIDVEGPTTGSTAGQITTLRLARITAENGTPGGTSQTIAVLDASDAASGGVFRSGAAAPTRAAGDAWSASIQTIATNQHQQFVWDFNQNNQGKGLTVRASVAEGWEIRAVTNGTAIGAAVNVTITFYWKEVP